MKAQDLRIGNLIYAPSGVEKYVFGTSYKTILYTSHLENSTYSEAYDYECEPIQLTEEWLLKFGYKEKDLEDGKIITVIENNKCIGFIINNLSSMVILKHVHQLQNLYFALTNNELEIL
jgi:hypothetical protein